MEREVLLGALAEAGHNVSQAARKLGISRDTLRYRMEKHRLRHRTSG
ncbi:MAG TPA: helix-turn-helix domain-containing protein [Accumulibacter sp.]|nr:helix-turn-helix domain-containing protein [Accumulibacter sp.]